MPVWTFVRHGQSVANAQGWFAGRIDSGLTALGRAQAEAARPQMADVRARRAFSSDLCRAHDTAKILLAGSELDPVTTPRLQERDIGAWARQTPKQVSAHNGWPILRSWTLRPPDGESLRDVAVRALTWLHEVDEDIDTLVVCHGALMRSVLGAIDGLPPTEIGVWKPRNCEFATRTLAVGTFGRLLAELPS